MANFKDGVVKDGSTIGMGKALGNIKDGVIKDGSSNRPLKNPPVPHELASRI